jgi:hypothetical protein
MKRLMMAAALLIASPAMAHEPWITKATGPTPTIENSTHYSAMNWMCPDTPEVEKRWPGSSTEARLGFTRAVADTLVLTGQACIPPQLTSKDLADIGGTYLDDHPDRDYVLDDSAAKLLIEAFTKKWPCVQS